MTKLAILLALGLVILANAFFLRKQERLYTMVAVSWVFGIGIVVRVSLALLGTWPLSAYERDHSGDFATVVLALLAAATWVDFIRGRRRAGRSSSL